MAEGRVVQPMPDLAEKPSVERFGRQSVGPLFRAVANTHNEPPSREQNPEPKVGISEFADSSINIYARLWCKQVDYWDVMFEINKNIHEEFQKQNITIPFPQRDVHIYEEHK